MNNLAQFNTLTDEQRLEARDRAAAIVVKAVGDKPRRDSFAHSTVSRYPAWFTRLIAAMMSIVFAAAAAPSLFRLFTAGRDYFAQGINDALQASIVGFSTFLLAEFLIILSTISARVYFHGRGRWIFVIPVLMGLTMALVGNWTVVQPHDLFSVLEAVIPVSTVLFVALIGERLILDAIETRHANERAYQEALHNWQMAASNPESHPRYSSALANALKHELSIANGKGAGATARRELMARLDNEHWRWLVIRELAADEWYQGDSALPEPPSLPRNNSGNIESFEISEDKPTAPRPFGSTARTIVPEGQESMIAIESAGVLHNAQNGKGAY